MHGRVSMQKRCLMNTGLVLSLALEIWTEVLQNRQNMKFLV